MRPTLQAPGLRFSGNSAGPASASYSGTLDISPVRAGGRAGKLALYAIPKI
ncbi:hypothetical protein GM658_03695 [Pseudoduganella eburnea]|uniref:Uncharacterized protein n=1 Tax=Massilia eburnea TaxID=1776165 RepID=A0A6L6QC27_9BURK|nr:hypothetical protein [Massilia eburnea]MTW09695.1 hypothetical protein [Massilia eburnea]